MESQELKKVMLDFIEQKGPSLPVHVSRQTGQSILMAGAFLSDLVAEKRLRITNMKVGGSPVYYLPGQEPMLEKFSGFLPGKEREAFSLLKEKKVLQDDLQLPAIRVALRAIRDFAFPMKQDEKLFWRYLTIDEEEARKEFKDIKPGLLIKKEGKKEERKEEKKQEKKEERKEKKIEKSIIKKAKGSEKFFNKLKEFLSEKSIELLDIEEFSKTQISVKVREGLNEKLIMAFNKKRVNENDIIKAGKKASELNLPYTILALGEPLKKLKSFIEALKNLEGIGKIE